LFYLMSRGFSEVEAKHIIVESMIRPIIDRIGDDVIEEAALTAVRNKI
jgi:sufB/sufD domain protein